MNLKCESKITIQMEHIKKYITLLENDYIEEDLKKLSPKDRLNWYLLIKEFEVPKLQRAGFQHGDDTIEEIVVKYVGKLKKKA